MPHPADVRLSYEAYLALERATQRRHEWYDGVAVAMTGGSIAHAQIIANLTGLLRTAVRGGPCTTFSSELKVRPPTGLATYADATVICGAVEVDPEDRHAVTNPSLLVEVLSPSTEAWDRGEKLAHYKTAPSLQHVLLVSSRVRRVEHHRRLPDGTWAVALHGPGDLVEIQAIGASIPVDEVFEGLDLPVGPLFASDLADAPYAAAREARP